MRHAIALVLAATLAVSCGTPPMTTEQAAEHTAALQQAETAQAEAEAAQAAAFEAGELLADAMARASELEAALSDFEAAPANASPDQVAALVGELNQVSEAVALARAARSQADAQLAAALASRSQAEDTAADVEAEAAQAAGGAVMDLVGSIFPPAKGVSDAWLWLAPLLFKRPRENLAKVAKEAVELTGTALVQNPRKTLAQARELLRSVGATAGLKHTTDDPGQLVANAATLAAKSPDFDLAAITDLLANAYQAKVGELGGDPATGSEPPTPPSAEAA